MPLLRPPRTTRWQPKHALPGDMQSSIISSPCPYRGISPALNFPAEHDRGSILGKGAGGTVEAWTHRPSGIILAIKIIKHEDSMPVEVLMLKDFPLRPSIVRFDAFYANIPQPNTDCMIFEHCSGGDLYEFRKYMHTKNKAIFSEAFMWSLYYQLSDALAFLHEGIGARQGTDAWRIIAHRDIKAQNICISTLGNSSDMSSIIVKLTDFGLATFYDPATSRMPGIWGTTTMWPPEQTWEDRKATPAGDIWAIGYVIHELAHSFPPIVSWKSFSEAWWIKNRIPEDWSELRRWRFYGAKALRQVQPKEARRKRPCPKYSNGLNECMMMALELIMTERATAGSLKRRVEEGRAAFLFEELRRENEDEERELHGSSSEDWDD